MLVLVKMARAAGGGPEPSDSNVLEPDFVLKADGRVLIPSGEIRILRDGDSIRTRDVKDHILVQMAPELLNRLVDAHGELIMPAGMAQEITLGAAERGVGHGTDNSTVTRLFVAR